MRWPRASAAAVAVAVALAPRLARAQKLDAPLTTTPAMPSTGLELQPHHTFWQDTKVRPFVAARIDLGYIYVRPLLAVGYGRAYWKWVGFEASPIGSGAGLAAYGGLRLALPQLEVRSGARYFFPFRRSFLAPQDTYTQLDADSRVGPASRYVSLEAEATTNLRAGPGDVIVLATGHYLLGVNPGYYVFDETMRVVADPPWLWRGRLGYAIPLTDDRLFRIAPVIELIGVPGRDTLVGRGGFVASATFSDFIDVIATFVPVLFGPDKLGLSGADFAQIGMRFRWASGVGGAAPGPGGTLSGPPPARPGTASPKAPTGPAAPQASPSDAPAGGRP